MTDTIHMQRLAQNWRENKSVHISLLERQPPGEKAKHFKYEQNEYFILMTSTGGWVTPLTNTVVYSCCLF